MEALAGLKLLMQALYHRRIQLRRQRTRGVLQRVLGDKARGRATGDEAAPHTPPMSKLSCSLHWLSSRDGGRQLPPRYSLYLYICPCTSICVGIPLYTWTDGAVEIAATDEVVEIAACKYEPSPTLHTLAHERVWIGWRM